MTARTPDIQFQLGEPEQVRLEKLRRLAQQIQQMVLPGGLPTGGSKPYILSPEHFGAKGVAGADDTGTMQDAFNNAKALAFRPGALYTVRGLTMFDGQTLGIYGNGATLRVADGADNLVVNHVGSSSGTVRMLYVSDLIIDGNHQNQNKFVNGLWAGFYDFVAFERCQFINGSGNLCWLRHVVELAFVSRCRFGNGKEHTGILNQNTAYIGGQTSPTRDLTGAQVMHFEYNVMRGIIPVTRGYGIGGIIVAGNRNVPQEQTHRISTFKNTLFDCGQQSPSDDTQQNRVAAIHLYRGGNHARLIGDRVIRGQYDGILCQATRDLLISGPTVRDLDSLGEGTAIQFQPRDGNKVCTDTVVENANIENVTTAVDASFTSGLPARNLSVRGGTIRNVTQVFKSFQVAGNVEFDVPVVEDVTLVGPTTGRHCITIGASNADPAVEVNVAVRTNIKGSANLAVRIRNITGDAHVSGRFEDINDSSPIQFTDITGNVLWNDSVLEDVDATIAGFNNVTGKIILKGNVAPDGADYLLSNGSVVYEDSGNTWSDKLRTRAAATDMTYESRSGFWRITGTTTINTIAAPPQEATGAGKLIYLFFTTSITVNDSTTAAGNIQLAGSANLAAVSGNSLQLAWNPDLNAWVEVGRRTTATASSTRNLTAGAGLTGGGDLTADRTFDVGAGTGITVNADNVALDTAHARNVDHTAVVLTAGAGLTGGGDISANRTFDVGAGTGITITVDGVEINQAFTPTWTGQHDFTALPASAAPINVKNATPRFEYWETDQTTDEVRWRWNISAKVWSWGPITDAGASLRAVFNATRGTGTAITAIEIGNPTDNPPVTIWGPIELGNASDTSVTRFAAGEIAVEGKKVYAKQGFTVAGLPGGAVGDKAHVTDALAPAFGAAVVGGGAVTIPVFHDGTQWIVA